MAINQGEIYESASPIGAKDEGLFRDPVLDGVSDTMGVGEIWESEGDTVSLDEIRKILGRFANISGLRPMLAQLTATGVHRFREVLQIILTRDADRDVDAFGYDQPFMDLLTPFTRWIHDRYFRVETIGLEHIPATGRALIVANHSGTLPYDGAMVVSTVRFGHPQARIVRPMVEDFLYHFPYLGMFMARTGAVRACQQNALHLLEHEQLALVFPEGVKGIGKLFRKRYKLQRFGRGGAIRLAMKAGAPIIPCAIVGAEESMPLLSKMSWLAGPLGLPYIPVTPTLPLLGPLGLIPYPTKWYIAFGEPIDVTAFGPDAIKNRVLVNRLNEELRGRVQAMIYARIAARKSVFAG